MTEPIKRLHYFDHQFLRVDDFAAEQAYHLGMRRMHNRLLHTWGIAEPGLHLSFVSGAARVTISEGTAIEGQGQEIVLDENTQTADLSGFAGKAVYITIAYSEQQTDSTSETGVTGNTRWQETPVIEVTETAPADPSQKLILGRVSVGADGKISALDDGPEPNRRRSAGVVGGDLEVRSLTLTDPGVDRNSWPRLRLGAAGRADLQSNLKVTGNLEITGTVDGRDVSADGTKLDNHLAFNSSNPGNPHGTTAAQIRALPAAGGIITGDLQINNNLGVAGNVGIGVTNPTNALQVGANKSVRLELGPNQKLALGSNGSFEIDAPGVIGGRFSISDEGNVNIGGASQVGKLSISGSGANCAVYGEASGKGYKCAGQFRAAVDAGDNSSAYGIAVSASSNGTGQKTGVSITTNGDGGTKYGLFATASGSGTHYALYGGASGKGQQTGGQFQATVDAGDNSDANGIYSGASSNGTGVKTGVRAYASGDGGAKYGLLSYASGSGVNCGFYGQASGKGQQTGGQFIASVDAGDNSNASGISVSASSNGAGQKTGVSSTASGDGGTKYGLVASASGSGPNYGFYGGVSGSGGQQTGGLFYANVADGDNNSASGISGSASSNGSGQKTAVAGSASGTGGVKIGVSGYASGDGGTKYGIYANTSGSGTNYAGFFIGNVQVTGTLSKGSGTFLIDHPLDPLNKVLRHSFVESPENLCLYRGKVQLDERGEGAVSLPTYFAALTKEPEATVNLTAIGTKPFAASYQWKQNHTAFTVFGEPRAEVSYLVLAERDDPVIHQLAEPVEEEKGTGKFERGKLLYPEAYGYSAEKGMHLAPLAAPMGSTAREMAAVVAVPLPPSMPEPVSMPLDFPAPPLSPNPALAIMQSETKTSKTQPKKRGKASE